MAIVFVLALSLLVVTVQSACVSSDTSQLTHCKWLPYDVDPTHSDSAYKYPVVTDFQPGAVWLGIGANYSDCELAYRAWWCFTHIPPCNTPTLPICSDVCYNVVARCGMIPDPTFTMISACYSDAYAAPGAYCLSYDLAMIYLDQPPLQCSAPRASEVSFCGPNFSDAVFLGPNYAAVLQALGAAQTRMAEESDEDQTRYNVPDKARCLVKYRELVCAYVLPICSPVDGKAVVPCDFGCQAYNDECPHGSPILPPWCVFNLLDPTTVGGLCPARAHFQMGALIGDPHFLTPDGAHYAYNPIGEFYLTKSLPNSATDVDVQARFELCQSGVTCLTAVAFKTSAHNFFISVHGLNASLFQDGVEVASSGYAADGLLFAKRVDGIFNSSVIWGVNLELYSIDYFIKVDIWGFTSVSVVYHESNHGQLAGLFGYFDGNRDNDYQAYPGTVDSGVPGWNSTNSLLGPLFGSTWRTTAQTSAMLYPSGKSWADYNNLNFAQTYYDTASYQPSELAYSSCVNIDSVFYTGCLFDVTQTGNTNYSLSHRSTLLYQDYLSSGFVSAAAASQIHSWWILGLVMVVKGALSAHLFD